MAKDERREPNVNERETVNLPKPPPWVNEILEAVNRGQVKQSAELAEFRKDVCMHFDRIEERQTTQENRQDTVESELVATKKAISERVKSGVTEAFEAPSGHDLKAQAAIAEEIVARQAADAAAEKRTKDNEDRIKRIEGSTTLIAATVLKGAGKVWADPKVRVLANAIVVAMTIFLTTWIAAHR